MKFLWLIILIVFGIFAFGFKGCADSVYNFNKAQQIETHSDKVSIEPHSDKKKK